MTRQAILETARARVALEVYGDANRHVNACLVENEHGASIVELTGRVASERVLEDGVRVVREHMILHWRALDVEALATAVGTSPPRKERLP